MFKSINKKSFTAEDGSVFDNESDLDVYNKLYDKTKPLFSSDAEKGSAQSILSIERVMLNCMQRMSGIASQTRQIVNLVVEVCHNRNLILQQL